MHEAVSLLQELIRIPSVNPMGRDIDGPEFLEEGMTQFLREYLEAHEVSYRCYSIEPRRANVVAWLEGTGPHTVLLDAHQDTVPVDGMTIPPFDGYESDGKIHGRGACDVKGGMAAMLTAFCQLATLSPEERPHVVLSCTCDEEATSIGINALTQMWKEGSADVEILKRPPTMAIVAEPTELQVVVAHRGATRWKLHTHGRACHSSDPRQGQNAIYAMAQVVDVLDDYAAVLPESRPAHRLCGPATLSVGRIYGGASVNVVPDQCTIEIDRRVIPGEDSYAVIDEVAAAIRERLDLNISMDPPWVASPPLDDADNKDVADRLLAIVCRHDPTRELVGVAYGTHASRTASAGVPSVVFGPGSIDQAHTKDEWISIEQLELASEIYFEFCRSLVTT